MIKVFVGKTAQGNIAAIPLDNVSFVLINKGMTIVGLKESKDCGGVELTVDEGERLVSVMVETYNYEKENQ